MTSRRAAMAIQSFLLQAFALVAYFAAGRALPQAKAWIFGVFVVASFIVVGHAEARLSSGALIVNVLCAGIAFVLALEMTRCLGFTFRAAMPYGFNEEAERLGIALVLGIAWWSAIALAVGLFTRLRGVVMRRGASGADA